MPPCSLVRMRVVLSFKLLNQIKSCQARVLGMTVFPTTRTMLAGGRTTKFGFNVPGCGTGCSKGA
jgi:hypothetical protein